MKCPHCNYINGYHWDENDNHVDVEGKEGDFFRLPIKLEREESFTFVPETAQVFGCPKCKIIFMED